MANLRSTLDLGNESDINVLNDLLFNDISEADDEPNWDEDSDTDGEDHVSEREEDSDSEQSDYNEDADVGESNHRKRKRISSHGFSSLQSAVEGDQAAENPQQGTLSSGLHTPVDAVQSVLDPGPQSHENEPQVHRFSNESMYYVAKFGKDAEIKWYFRPITQNQRTQRHNILRRLPGVKGNDIKTKHRRLFLRQLADDLVLDHLRTRSESIQRGMPLDLQTSLKKFRAEQPIGLTQETGEKSKLEKRKRCEPCKLIKKTRLTSTLCSNCKYAICVEHSVSICVACYPKMKPTSRDERSSSDDE